MLNEKPEVTETDCEKHGRTKALMLATEARPDEKRPVCVKCLAAAMVSPVRRSAA